MILVDPALQITINHKTAVSRMNPLPLKKAHSLRKLQKCVLPDTSKQRKSKTNQLKWERLKREEKRKNTN